MRTSCLVFAHRLECSLQSRLACSCSHWFSFRFPFVGVIGRIQTSPALLCGAAGFSRRLHSYYNFTSLDLADDVPHVLNCAEQVVGEFGSRRLDVGDSLKVDGGQDGGFNCSSFHFRFPLCCCVLFVSLA